MPSSFNGKNLFGSGPHRFAVGPQGQHVIREFIDPLGSGPATIALGLRELDITIRGRLIAPSESALWILRDAITAELDATPPPLAATLIDDGGRAWTDMSFLEFIESDRTDRARTVSLAYTAVFRRFREPL